MWLQKCITFILKHTILIPARCPNDYPDFHSEKILGFSPTCTRDRSKHFLDNNLSELNNYIWKKVNYWNFQCNFFYRTTDLIEKMLRTISCASSTESKNMSKIIIGISIMPDQWN